MFKKRTYLDYASLTPIDRHVLREMKKYSSAKYTNPSSLYKEGVAAKNALDQARKSVAKFIHATVGEKTDEIVFTSGGTEANNIALIGAVESLHEKGVDYEKMRILISAIEHSSVRECANELNRRGVVVDVAGVDKHGVVLLEDVKNKLKPNTVIVSIMTVNNEIGTIQPIREIAKIIRRARATSNKDPRGTLSPFDFQEFSYPIFHTDAAQAALHENLNVEQFGVDLLTLDSSKVYGPRGVGALYIKRNTPIAPIMFGGGQENGMRSGTENIPGVMGFAKALEIVASKKEEETARILQLKELFLNGLVKIRGDIHVNSPLNVSPHILNISIPGIDNELFVLRLDAAGIACSTKSSCLRDEEESYVLKSIGANSRNSVRFSFGRWTSRRDIKRALRRIGAVLALK